MLAGPDWVRIFGLNCDPIFSLDGLYPSSSVVTDPVEIYAFGIKLAVAEWFDVDFNKDDGFDANGKPDTVVNFDAIAVETGMDAVLTSMLSQPICESTLYSNSFQIRENMIIKLMFFEISYTKLDAGFMQLKIVNAHIFTNSIIFPLPTIGEPQTGFIDLSVQLHNECVFVVVVVVVVDCCKDAAGCVWLCCNDEYIVTTCIVAAFGRHNLNFIKIFW